MGKTIIEKEMDKLLKQKRNYTYMELCRHFKIKNHYDLIEHLGNYLNKKLDNYNFENNIKNNKYLSKTIRYFDYSLGKIDLEQNHDLIETIEIMNQIIDKIRFIVISNVNRESNQTVIENSMFLLTLEEQLERIISNIYHKIDISNRLDIIAENKLVTILKDVIFNVKSTTILESLLEKFPNLIIFKDSNNKLLFNKILDRHFNNLLNKKDYHDKMYYDKIIDLYTKYSYLSEDNALEETFYFKIQEFIKKVISKVMDEDKKNYVIADINERVRQFECGNEMDFLVEKSNDNYYSNINFDTIGNLVGKSGKEQRVNMTDRHIITIDNPEAKVLENAISIEMVDNRYLLSIYAVDVTDFIIRNKLFEKKKYDDILNNKINTKLFSSKYRYNNLNLLENKVMPVIAYDFLIDEDFHVSSFHFQRAIIKVAENLKFTDFDNKGDFQNTKTNDMVTTLSELLFPYLQEEAKDSKETIDIALRLINISMAREITKYTINKNLPLIYTNHNIKNIRSLISDLEEAHDVDLSFIKDNKKLVLESIFTIGNDAKEKNSDLNISIFSPTRKVNALINQMLINIYLVDHEKIDEYTKNYLETRLDKIATNLNNNKMKNSKCINNIDLADIKQYIKK